MYETTLLCFCQGIAKRVLECGAVFLSQQLCSYWTKMKASHVCQPYSSALGKNIFMFILQMLTILSFIICARACFKIIEKCAIVIHYTMQYLVYMLVFQIALGCLCQPRVYCMCTSSVAWLAGAWQHGASLSLSTSQPGSLSWDTQVKVIQSLHVYTVSKTIVICNFSLWNHFYLLNI